MPCTGISGINNCQKKQINEMICVIPPEDAPKEDYSIIFHIPIMPQRQNSLWYGGGIATISYKGFEFSVEARGEIRAHLYDAVTDDELVYIKDKSNNSVFYDKMRLYLKTDEDLIRALNEKHEKYRLTIADNNWWEIFVSDKDKEWLPESWVGDGDDIFSVVIETLRLMDEYLDEYVNTDESEVHAQ